MYDVIPVQVHQRQQRLRANERNLRLGEITRRRRDELPRRADVTVLHQNPQPILAIGTPTT